MMANETEQEEEFKDLTLEERIEHVNNRLGGDHNRIQTLNELAALEGETIYLLLSPMGDTGNSTDSKGGQVANCFFFTWKVGSVEDHRGNIITPESNITIDNNEKYLCYHYGDEEGMEDCTFSCKDWNIVPNCYNNHAAFRNEEDMRQYMTYRKMAYELDDKIDEIDPHRFPFWLTRSEIEEMRRIEKEYEQNTQE